MTADQSKAHETVKANLMQQLVPICNKHLFGAGASAEEGLVAIVQLLAALADVQGSVIAQLPEAEQRQQALDNLAERTKLVVEKALEQSGRAAGVQPRSLRAVQAPVQQQPVQAPVQQQPVQAPVQQQPVQAPVQPVEAVAKPKRAPLQVVPAQEPEQGASPVQHARGTLPAIDE